MKENILLVGATGTIGFSLAKQLAKKNVQCRCLVRNLENAAHLKELGMELVLGDLAVMSTLPGALKGVEKVFLCTPLEPNVVELQGNLVLAAKGAGVKHFVKVSTIGASPRSNISFALWHGLTEQKIRDLQIPFTFLQPHYFMQNTLMFKASMKSADTIFTPMSDAPISMVDSDDIAAVACAVLTSSGHENKAYEITGPEALSFSQVATVLSETLGRAIEHMTLPTEVMQNAMREQGTPAWLIDGTTNLYKFFDTGDAAFVRTTIQDVAHKPATHFREFVARYADYFRS
jgi:uncharacterized protein YbjT (DUF2867 family)